MPSGSASGDSINTRIVNLIESLLIRTGCQFGKRAISLASIKSVRVIVTGAVQLLIIERVHAIFKILVRLPAAESSEVPAIRHESTRSTAVLWRCRAFSRDTQRVGIPRVDWQRGFEPQIVNPAVTKVIFVDESFESAQVQVTESHFRCIDTDHAAAVTIYRAFA